MADSEPRYVSFRIACSSTQPGDNLYVIGSTSALSNWNLTSETPKMKGHHYPIWETARIPFPREMTSVEYKYVIARDGHIIRWEEGENRVIPQTDASVSIDDGYFGENPHRQSTQLMSLTESIAASQQATGAPEMSPRNLEPLPPVPDLDLPDFKAQEDGEEDSTAPAQQAETPARACACASASPQSPLNFSPSGGRVHARRPSTPPTPNRFALSPAQQSAKERRERAVVETERLLKQVPLGPGADRVNNALRASVAPRSPHLIASQLGLPCRFKPFHNTGTRSKALQGVGTFETIQYNSQGGNPQSGQLGPEINIRMMKPAMTSPLPSRSPQPRSPPCVRFESTTSPLSASHDALRTPARPLPSLPATVLSSPLPQTPLPLTYPSTHTHTHTHTHPHPQATQAQRLTPPLSAELEKASLGEIRQDDDTLLSRPLFGNEKPHEGAETKQHASSGSVLAGDAADWRSNEAARSHLATTLGYLDQTPSL